MYRNNHSNNNRRFVHKEKYAKTYPIIGRVEFKLLKIVKNQYVHGRRRSIKVLFNPLNRSERVYGYHDFDGKFIEVNRKDVTLAA